MEVWSSVDVTHRMDRVSPGCAISVSDRDRSCNARMDLAGIWPVGELAGLQAMGSCFIRCSSYLALILSSAAAGAVKMALLRETASSRPWTGYRAQELIGKLAPVLRSGFYEQDVLSMVKSAVMERGSWQGQPLTRHKSGHLSAEQLTICRHQTEARNVMASAWWGRRRKAAACMGCRPWRPAGWILTVLLTCPASMPNWNRPV